jgi:hypothetical protein
MHFGLTDEQRLIVDTTRAFVERELYPHRPRVERTGHLRREVIEEVKAKAIEAGLYAANIPEEFGGAGLDTLTWLLYEKELGRPTTPSTGPAWRAPPTSSARHARAARALPRSLRPRRDLGLPRHDRARAGSDLRGMKAAAREDRRRLGPQRHQALHLPRRHRGLRDRLHGERRGGHAQGRKKRITAFFVDRGTPGLTIREGYRNVSHRGYTNSSSSSTTSASPPTRSWASPTRASRSPTSGSAPPASRSAPPAWAARAGLRPRRRMGRDPQPVRPAHRQEPGRQLQARRHGGGDEGRRADDPRSGLEVRPGHRRPTPTWPRPSSRRPRCWPWSPTRPSRSTAAWA